METVLLNIIKMLTSRKFLDENNIDINYKKILKQTNEERIFTIKSDFDNKYFHIMFVYGKITTIKKIQGLNSFIENSKGHNRLFVCDHINQKAYKQFIEYPNTEVFFEYELLVNIIDHDLQPKFIILSDKEKEDFLKEYQITKKQMSKMRSIDPVARYYNLKGGDVVKIIRPSTSSGLGIHYRIIIESHTSEIFDKK